MNRGRILVLAGTILLTAFGLAVLASAQEEGSNRFAKQLVWVAAGAVCAAAIVYAGSDLFFRWAHFIAGAGILLLGAVLLTRPVHGVRAWFDLYLFKIQPAELSRSALLVFLARVLGSRDKTKTLTPGEPVPGPRNAALAAAVTVVMIGLVMAEPDIGVALGMVFIFGGAVLSSGVQRKLLAAGTAGAAVLAVVLYAFGLSEQQKQRMAAWASPEQYSRGAAWQMTRSRTAVGSGGLTGKGWGKGDVNRLGLLPVKDSDFIFAVVAEELGFVAVAGLTAAYLVLVSGCFVSALSSRDRRHAVLCAAAGTYFGTQAALNIGVAMGVLPTTGVTLPFVSYGGSSMLSNFAMVGLVMSGGGKRRAAGVSV